LLTIKLTISDQQMVAGPAVRGTFAADTHAAMRPSLDTRQHTNAVQQRLLGKPTASLTAFSNSCDTPRNP
jgi:hypothetical protein